MHDRKDNILLSPHARPEHTAVASGDILAVFAVAPSLIKPSIAS